MSNVLATELDTYKANLPQLLAAHEGKFVVIHGEAILGALDDQSDAIAWGYRQLGNVPFLAKRVVKVDVPLSFVSGLLGI